MPSAEDVLADVLEVVEKRVGWGEHMTTTTRELALHTDYEAAAIGHVLSKEESPALGYRWARSDSIETGWCFHNLSPVTEKDDSVPAAFDDARIVMREIECPECGSRHYAEAFASEVIVEIQHESEGEVIEKRLEDGETADFRTDGPASTYITVRKRQRPSEDRHEEVEDV